MTPEQIQAEMDRINAMTQVEMVRLWRFAPSGHLWFNAQLPFYAVFKARFDSLGGFTPAVSKAVGW